MKTIELVRRVIDAFDAPLAQADDVAAWVATIAEWNQRMDLTAARNDDELVDLMVADSAKLASLIEHAPEGSLRVIDVGSGAGAPGLPLALLRGDLDLTLVEPLQKRATLLRLSKGRHPSAHITVRQERGGDVKERFDVALSRATLPPPEWLTLGARLAPSVWVLLAKQPPPTLAGWRIQHDERYQWPLTGADRRIVRYVPEA